MSTSWQILNLARHATRIHKRETADDEKLNKVQSLTRKYGCYCLISCMLVCLVLVYIHLNSSHLFRHNEINIDPNSVETLDPSKDIIAIVMSAKWNEVRRRNSMDICDYFTRHRVKCVVMDGFDGRNLTAKDKERLVEQGYIHKNFNGMHISTKVGTAMSKIMAMQTVVNLAAQQRTKEWKYAVLFEDDALIGDRFLEALQERFIELKYYLPEDENNEKWDILQLFGAQWCDPWNFSKRFSIKYLGHSMYQYLYGFALYTAVMSPITSLQRFLEQCLPFEEASDIWIGHFVQKGLLKAYMTCPPIAGEIGGPSVIHPDRSFPKYSIIE